MVTKLATWSSSSAGVATIDSSAMATGIADGSTTITAFFPAGVLTSGKTSGTTTLTVFAGVQLTSITVSPATASLLVGDHQQYLATGIYSDNSQKDLTNSVTWSSPAPTLASVSSSGLATALGAGSAVIQASLGSVTGTSQLTIAVVTVDLTSITVAPPGVFLPVGGKQQYSATGTYSDGSHQDLTNSATWSSSAPTLASISSSGLATALAPGSAVIQATVGSVSGTGQLTVSSSNGGSSSTGSETVEKLAESGEF